MKLESRLHALRGVNLLFLGFLVCLKRCALLSQHVCGDRDVLRSFELQICRGFFLRIKEARSSKDDLVGVHELAASKLAFFKSDEAALVSLADSSQSNLHIACCKTLSLSFRFATAAADRKLSSFWRFQGAVYRGPDVLGAHILRSNTALATFARFAEITSGHAMALAT